MRRLWLVFFVILLITSSCKPKPKKDETVDPLQQARFATVFLSSIGADGKLTGGICSGTYLGDNLVLTNWHCIGCNAPFGCPDKGLKFGETVHPEGQMQIAKLETYDRPPVPAYVARLARGDPTADVAVLKIFQVWADPGASLPSPLPIPTISIGDSMKAKLNDPIHVVGFPTVGFGTVNSDPGEITGFLDFINNDQERDTFKVSAAINGGNSGGLLMNAAGQQIGIPQFRSNPEAGVGVNGAIMVHIALPFVEEARNGAAVLPPSQSPFLPVPPKIEEAKPLVGPIQFGLDQNDAWQNPKQTFPAGTKQVVAVFTVIGLKDGTPWGYKFYDNEVANFDKRNSEIWSGGLMASAAVERTNPEGLLAGKYELEIYVNGAAFLKDGFTVEEALPKIVPDNLERFTLKGSVIDTYTRLAISNATVFIARAGVSELNRRIFGSSAVTDTWGSFTISMNIERGQKYDIEISAVGYKTARRNDTFSATDPTLLTYKPFELEPW